MVEEGEDGTRRAVFGVRVPLDGAILRLCIVGPIIPSQEDTRKGDLSRWTFDPQKRFSQVLMQQGRVRLRAGWNE